MSFAYHTSWDLLSDQIDKRMESSVEFVAMLIGDDYFNRAVTPDAISENEYFKNAKKLIHIADDIGFMNLYTLVKIDGKYHFTNNNGFTIPYFNEYSEHWPNLALTSQDGKTRFDEGSDSYGSSRSVIIRKTTTAGTDYLVGADVRLDSIASLNRHMFYQALVVGAISFFMVGFFSYVVSQLITRPLKGLNDYVLQIRRDGFATEHRIDPRLLPSSPDAGDETRVLAKNVDEMHTALVDSAHQLEETAAARERVESELRIAGKLQQSLLPGPLDHPERCDVAGRMQPAKHAGGDLYDYFWLDDRRLCFMIGDVSGKGMPAAMFMSTCLTLFRAVTKPDAGKENDITAMMHWVDRRLADHNEAFMFVTAIMGILDCESGEIVLCNGGHNPPVLLVQNKSRYLQLDGGVPVGVDAGKPFLPTRFQLHQGETILFYTDGVTEAMGVDGSFYGEQRLLEILDAKPSGGNVSTTIVETVFNDVLRFSSGRDLADDVTVLAVGIR